MIGCRKLLETVHIAHCNSDIDSISRRKLELLCCHPLTVWVSNKRPFLALSLGQVKNKQTNKQTKTSSHLQVSSIFKYIEIFNFHINLFCLYSKVDSTILQIRKLKYQILRTEPGDFPSSPAVGDFTFQCRWYGFDPWLEIWAPTCLVIKKPKTHATKTVL